MRQKLLVIVLLIAQFTFATTSVNSVSDPGVGVIMWGNFTSQGNVYYSISVKNTSSEPLTNIYITNIELYMANYKFVTSFTSLKDSSSIVLISMINYK